MRKGIEEIKKRIARMERGVEKCQIDAKERIDLKEIETCEGILIAISYFEYLIHRFLENGYEKFNVKIHKESEES